MDAGEHALKEGQELLEHAREFEARYAALTPEQKDEVDRSHADDAPEYELLDQIFGRVLDGSIPVNEALVWLEATSRNVDKRFT